MLKAVVEQVVIRYEFYLKSGKTLPGQGQYQLLRADGIFCDDEQSGWHGQLFWRRLVALKIEGGRKQDQGRAFAGIAPGMAGGHEAAIAGTNQDILFDAMGFFCKLLEAAGKIAVIVIDAHGRKTFPEPARLKAMA